MPSIHSLHTAAIGVDSARLLARDAVSRIVVSPTAVEKTSEAMIFCLNGGLSIALVIIGGLFAGLTLAFMGQDQVYLQVVARSGCGKDRENAQKVLSVLQRGKHWVLVSLLLGNVIVNETLPIILDQEVKGGWFAVLVSTTLIVIFGEVIPQSLCAKHGLSIGAWSSKYVKWVMYLLFPVAYPIAKLLDHLLGASHGVFFDRAGLKTLVMLHECLNFSSERLNREEVAVITSILDLKTTKVSSVMTPISKLYTLSVDKVLDDMTQYNVLSSGYSGIPIHIEHCPSSFIGVLPVKSLVALRVEEEVTIGKLTLDTLLVVRPDISCQDILHFFRDRSVRIVLVTERGTPHGEPLGIVTARDVMNELIKKMTGFQWNQQDTAQVETLCSRCSAIDMSEVIQEAQQLESSNGGLGVGTLISNLGPVSDWCTDCCGLCKVLLASIPEASREQPPDNYSLHFHYRQDRRLGIYYPLLKSLPPTATILKLDGPDAQAHYVSSPFLVLRPADGSSGVRLLKSNSVEFPVIRSWLDLCGDCHTETCGSPIVLPVSSLKLIDCKTRTVILADAKKHQPYVTLSYVCGTINDPPHAPDELPSPAPETIEDAIMTTLNLGLQYLWVDRYCIDQQNLPNKLAQIQQMNLIYSTSEITLIAAAGKDAYYGLPGVNKRPRTQQSYSNFGTYQIISTLQPIGPVRGALEHTYWSTRAWCYQEALLSKRRLIFTDEQVYYECHGMSSCEVFDLPYREMHKENGQSFRDEYLHFSTRDTGKPTAGVGKAPYHLFKRIEEYTKKNLSFQSDRLNAFLGILNRFETELHSSRHLWGQPMVPEMDLNYMTETRSQEESKNWYGLGSFVDGLAWGLRDSGGRERDRPSWPWTGWASPIRYKYIYSTMHVPEDFPLAIVEFETEDGQVLDWDRFQARYSCVANSSQSCRMLHITAMTLPIRLIEDEDSEYWFEMDLHDGCYLSWPATTSPDESDPTETTWLLQRDLQSNAKPFALMTTLSVFEESPSYLFLLVIAEVDGVMERVGGGWLGPKTVLCTPQGNEIQVEEHGEWVSGLEAKYGRDWWKDLVKKKGTHRIG